MFNPPTQTDQTGTQAPEQADTVKSRFGFGDAFFVALFAFDKYNYLGSIKDASENPSPSDNLLPNETHVCPFRRAAIRVTGGGS